MNTRQASPSPLRNSTCRHVGHEWKSGGLAPNYRVCTREHCRAAQRLMGGEWIDVLPHPSTRPFQPTVSCVPSSLWTSRPPSEGPVRDREQERHCHELEQRYYKAVADDALYRAALTRRQRGGV